MTLEQMNDSSYDFEVGDENIIDNGDETYTIGDFIVVINEDDTIDIIDYLGPGMEGIPCKINKKTIKK